MHQHHVGLAPCAEGQRGAGPYADGLDPVAGFLLEERYQHVEEATVLGARRCGQNELLVAPGPWYGGGRSGSGRGHACRLGGWFRWLGFGRARRDDQQGHRSSSQTVLHDCA
jgi:hypothetical protein